MREGRPSAAKFTFSFKRLATERIYRGRIGPLSLSLSLSPLSSLSSPEHAQDFPDWSDKNEAFDEPPRRREGNGG